VKFKVGDRAHIFLTSEGTRDFLGEDVTIVEIDSSPGAVYPYRAMRADGRSVWFSETELRPLPEKSAGEKRCGKGTCGQPECQDCRPIGGKLLGLADWIPKSGGAFFDLNRTREPKVVPDPDQGRKYDQEKLRWATLVPWRALFEVVEVLEFGARKYSPNNWRKVPGGRERYLNALMRHAVAYCSGEKVDAETGKSHLAHLMCCALYVLTYDLEGLDP